MHEFQLAEVEIQVCGWSAVIKAAVQSDLSYDVLLGLDFPYTWEAAFQELDKAAVLLVRTRQQALADEKEKPRKKSQEAREVALMPMNIESVTARRMTQRNAVVDLTLPPRRMSCSDWRRSKWIILLVLRTEKDQLTEAEGPAAVCTNLAGTVTLRRVC